MGFNLLIFYAIFVSKQTQKCIKSTHIVMLLLQAIHGRNYVKITIHLEVHYQHGLGVMQVGLIDMGLMEWKKIKRQPRMPSILVQEFMMVGWGDG